MSRFLVVCYRNSSEDHLIETRIRSLCHYLAPDNISVRRPDLRRQNGVLVAVLNPSSTVRFEGVSLCLGHMFEKRADWFRIGSPVPDGSYAMVRVAGQQIELLTDATASRTVWYVKTEMFFAASSSTRALICLLGSFEPNKAALAWMLSSGTLGPGNSWDCRVRLLPPQSSLVLDSTEWKASVNTCPIVFDVEDKPSHKFTEESLAILKDVFASIDVRKHRLAVPLSGGYDSRAILLMLQNRDGVQAVTWGERASLDDPESDAAIAPRVAHALGVPHRFCPTNASKGSLDATLKRYVSIGEGRIDHLSGYLDGFSIWKTLFDEGYDAILRGDVPFPHVGSPPIDSFDVRQNASIWLLRLSDYSNLPTCADLELPDQEFPEDLLPKAHESLGIYRDRLYHAFRMPIVLSALNELKTAYVEVINPFGSSRFVNLVRTQSDAVRTEKTILRQYVHDMGPNVPIARRASTQSFESLWTSTELKQVLASELASEFSRHLLSSSVLRIAEDGIAEMGNSMKAANGIVEPSGAWRCLKRVARRVRHHMTGPRPWGKPDMSRRIFAFRAFLIVKTCRMLLSDDSQFFARLRRSS